MRRFISFNDISKYKNASVESISKDILKNPDKPSVSPLERIKDAYEAGTIDEKAKILLYTYSLFDNSRLDSSYRSAEPIKSGTSAMEEIQKYIRRPNADRPTVDTIKQYMDISIPELDKTYTSPSGYFKIHYTTSGTHAVSMDEYNNTGIPRYIQLIGAAFDNVKTTTCDVRGFRSPVQSEKNKYFDIFVYDLKGIYGITSAINHYPSSRFKASTASCHISIDNSYSGEKGFKKSKEDCIKVTAAHEFFHAVQNAYNVDADVWWKEASATWNEDEIFSGVNDYLQYLEKVLSHPEKPLEKYSYGGVIFAKYLSENFGGYKIIKRIWEAQSSVHRNSLNAIDYTIKQDFINEDIGTVFNRFTACNFNPVQYYREGSLWNKTVAFQNIFTSFPTDSQSGQLNHLSANYQLFKLSNEIGEKDIKIIIHGAERAKLGFKIQKRRIIDNLCDMTEITIDRNKTETEIHLKNPARTYKELCLIPANLERELDNVTYNYSVDML